MERISLSGPPNVNLSVKSSQHLTSDLRIGDILTVEIEEVITPQKVLINLNGKSLLAHTTFPLSKGKKISVVVDRKDSAIILRPVPAKSNNRISNLVSLIRRLPPGQFNIGNPLLKLVQKLTETGYPGKKTLLTDHILDEDSMAAGGEKSASALEKIIRNSGLFFESKLKDLTGAKGESGTLKNDLKLLLLELLGRIEKEGEHGGLAKNSADSLPSLKDAITNLMRQIESNQSLNTLSKLHGGDRLLQVPYLIKGEIGTIKIYVKDFKGKEKRERKRDFSISMNLDLKNTGPMRIDLIAKEEELKIAINVFDEQVGALFNLYIDTLKESLKYCDYSINLECRVSEKDSDKEEESSNELFSDGYWAKKYRLLDLKV